MVEKPDVIGAIFGQTEGLLGADMELRELQKSGRIGRIDVKLKNSRGKTRGMIELPSSMGKAETAIIAAAMETIDRIGPCEAKVKVKSVEDVREVKRDYIKKRAKDVLKETLMKGPDTQEIVLEVARAVRQSEVVSYGKDRLPGGPAVRESEQLILVEGRADVLNMLKYGIKNVLALDGTKVSDDAISLSRTKTTTLFLDGDRGGILIAKEVMARADVDFVAMAPDGKEVEELTSKELHKALRSADTAEKFCDDHDIKYRGSGKSRKSTRKQSSRSKKTKSTKKSTKSTQSAKPKSTKSSKKSSRRGSKSRGKSKSRSSSRGGRKSKLTEDKRKNYKKLLDDLLGTKGAYLLSDTEVLGKVPISELARYLEILKADTVVMDGEADRKIASICKSHGIKTVVAKEAGKVHGVDVVLPADLE